MAGVTLRGNMTIPGLTQWKLFTIQFFRIFLNAVCYTTDLPNYWCHKQPVGVFSKAYIGLNQYFSILDILGNIQDMELLLAYVF